MNYSFNFLPEYDLLDLEDYSGFSLQNDNIDENENNNESETGFSQESDVQNQIYSTTTNNQQQMEEENVNSTQTNRFTFSGEGFDFENQNLTDQLLNINISPKQNKENSSVFSVFNFPFGGSGGNLKTSKNEVENEIDQKKDLTKYRMEKKYQQTETKTEKEKETETETKINCKEQQEYKQDFEMEFEGFTRKTRSKTLEDNSVKRKRNITTSQLKKQNSVTIESGKEIFKLLTGAMWVMSHGATPKTLEVFTEKISERISQALDATEMEMQIVEMQLKNLLSNSRRTLTEYILEIIVGVLALNHRSNTPTIAIEFKETLKKIAKIESLDNAQSPKQEKLKNSLEAIYKQIFTERLLIFWFEKRFVDRPDHLLTQELKTHFFGKHLYYLGKSKFVLSCLLLANQLIMPSGVVKRYSKLIDLAFNGDALNCYCNKRGKKLKLIKSLIVKYGINSGVYWSKISEESMKKLPFCAQNMFEITPFKEIISSSQLNLMSQKVQVIKPPKIRSVACKGKIPNTDIGIGWLLN
ncbi:hypothetical protein M0813_05051 [Anaeramoeba flamelloides]|uniref:Uncharacterized protein n=1 Tax=Anaeramoeba flamelloides TaxID=1746091 RepID=A0ABQ8XKR6_9EUKA|nr:hypothetical protein M0813_05051 [Anaeramoeba flamelloides]